MFCDDPYYQSRVVMRLLLSMAGEFGRLKEQQQSTKIGKLEAES
jgi:hypothetical protein